MSTPTPGGITPTLEALSDQGSGSASGSGPRFRPEPASASVSRPQPGLVRGVGLGSFASCARSTPPASGAEAEPAAGTSVVAASRSETPLHRTPASTTPPAAAPTSDFPEHAP